MGFITLVGPIILAVVVAVIAIRCRIWIFKQLDKPADKLALSPDVNEEGIDWVASLSKGEKRIRNIWLWLSPGKPFGLIASYFLVRKRHNLQLIEYQRAMIMVILGALTILGIAAGFGGFLRYLWFLPFPYLFALASLWLTQRMRQITVKVWTTTFIRYDQRYQCLEQELADATTTRQLAEIRDQHKDSWPKACHKLLQERFEARKAELA